MNYQSPKSATTAGLLGIFLGGFGAHWWYLGDKKKALIHVGLIGGGLLFEIISGIVTASMTSSLSGLAAGLSGGFGITAILSGVGGLVIAGNSIWALVEAIQILAGGDSGLAAKGIPVAQPMMNSQAQPQYGAQPMPQTQPMPQAQQYQQPMQQGYAQQTQYQQPQYQQPMQQPVQPVTQVHPASEQPQENQSQNMGGQQNAA